MWPSSLFTASQACESENGLCGWVVNNHCGWSSWACDNLCIALSFSMPRREVVKKPSEGRRLHSWEWEATRTQMSPILVAGNCSVFAFFFPYGGTFSATWFVQIDYHSEDLKVKIQSFSCLLFKKHSRANIFIFTCGTEIISHTAIFLPTKCRYEQ